MARSLTEGIMDLEDGIALFDRAGILIICNEAYRKAYPLNADLLVPGVSIRTILWESAVRSGVCDTEAEMTAWVEERLERHFWMSGVSEHKLANDRWCRIAERHTATGHVLKILTDITEQKRLDEALLTMEARVAEALESLEEGVALFDANDELVMSNHRYGELFPWVSDIIAPGVKFETLIRTGAARHKSIESMGDAEDWVETRLDHHHRGFGTFEHHFSGGQWILVRERRTADGGIIGTYSDITLRKERERDLEQALEDVERAHGRMQTMIDSTLDWIWTSDISGNVTCERRSDASETDFDPAPIIAQALTGFSAEGVEAPQANSRMLETRAPFRNLIHDARTPEGREIHLRIDGRPGRDKNGVFQGYHGAASDVTLNVEAEREVARRSAMHQATIESAAQGIVVFNAALELQIANQRALAMLSIKELVPGGGLHLEQIVEPAVAQQILSWHARNENLEMPLIERRSLAGVVIEIRANSMPDGGLVLTLTDVTDRMLAEDRSHQAQKMVALGHLVGGVAHEFNNLLTSIGGFSKMALDKCDQAEFVRDCLEEVILAADRAANLTRQMLAFGRKQPIDTKVISAAKIVVELERMLRSLLPESIELEIAISDEDAYIKSDAAQMSQALLNLAINARDAMPSGGKLTFTLTIGAMPPSSDPNDTRWVGARAAIYRIADTGTGIDENTLSQIFDPFFTTKEPGKGTGLGLSFVHGIVERSGGEINVESKVGVGTVFEVILPLVERGESISEAEAPITARNCTETILVVEDEAGVRSFVSRVLADCGYAVISAANRDDAIRAFESAAIRPHLLLTDIVLPGPSGPDIARELLQIAPRTKVMFMTGYADRDGLNLDQIRPGDVRLDKPFSPAVLANAVRAALDGSSQPANQPANSLQAENCEVIHG